MDTGHIFRARTGHLPGVRGCEQAEPPPPSSGVCTFVHGLPPSLWAPRSRWPTLLPLRKGPISAPAVLKPHPEAHALHGHTAAWSGPSESPSRLQWPGIDPGQGWPTFLKALEQQPAQRLHSEAPGRAGSSQLGRARPRWQLACQAAAALVSLGWSKQSHPGSQKVQTRVWATGWGSHMGVVSTKGVSFLRPKLRGGHWVDQDAWPCW